MKKTIYIAGPMRGIPYYNFTEFDMAVHVLRGDWNVLSPADMDRENGFNPFLLPKDHDWKSIPEGFSFNDCITRDIAALRKADAIYMLDGWEKSKGACAEKALAEWLGLSVFYQTIALTKVKTDEVRVTDPDTGAQKGSKLARFDLLPVGPLWELAEHFGKGAQKYAPRNYEAGYAWSLSFAAAMRHLWAFWRGEDRDPETGTRHVISAAWHCFALALFSETHPEKDDRVKLEKR